MKILKINHYIVLSLFTFLYLPSFAQSNFKTSSLELEMKRIVSDLSSVGMNERIMGSQELVNAAEFISNEFASIGILPISGFQKYLDPYFFKPGQNSDSATNVVGIVKGSEFPSEYIIISAHYDVNVRLSNFRNYANDFDYSVRRDSLGGVNDNASGVAMMLALARLLITDSIKPKRSVIFLALSGQDLGYRGANHFVNLFTDKKVLKFNINLDAVGLPEANRLYFTRSQWSDFIPDMIKSSYKKNEGKRIRFEPFSKEQPLSSNEAMLPEHFSDHVAFEQDSIPSTTVTTSSAQIIIHRSKIVPKTLNFAFMSQASELLYQAIQPLLQKE